MKILAADIGGTNTKVALCDGEGRIEGFREYATESERGGPHVIGRLIAHLEPYDGYDAIGICTAGQVDAETGRIVYANENIPDYTGMEVGKMLSERFGKPVRVENDVNAVALGEGRFGAARAFNDYLCIAFGTGIGGAIVMNRRIYRGADGVAAEFGHMILGNGGTFYETHASTSALVRRAQEIDKEIVNARALFDKMEKKHCEELSAVFDQWTSDVAAGLASLVHIFNPAAMILGGGIMERDDVVKVVERKTKALVMPSFRRVSIIRAELGNKAGILGAASLWLS